MFREELGPVRFVVEHRVVGRSRGPTLRVARSGSGGRELLRFDCFDEGAHWHLDPGGRGEVTQLPPSVDALEWTLGELRRDLRGYLARVGVQLDPRLSPAAIARALEAVEAAMRNPPVDLDDLDVSVLRTSRGEKWTVYPEDVLPLWVADMDFPLAPPIRRALGRALDRSDLRYPMHPRPTDLPALFAARMEERFGWKVEPRNVELITDVVQGLYVALQQFSRAGDGVVVQTPIYPPFLGAVAQLKRRLVENPLAPGRDGYEPDVDGLRNAVDDRTRVLLLCNPHNPSGRVFRRSELEAIAEIALARDLVVVSDEIHQDLILGDAPHVPFAALSPEVEARTLTLTSASKAFNIAGLRCALAAFGSAEIERRFQGVARHLRGGLGILGIEATRAAWRHGQPWLDRVRAYLRANRDFVAKFVAEELPGVGHHPPEATYLAWLDCRELALEPSPYRFFLERARVALSDGAAFGRSGRGFVRLNFATSRAILEQALQRMADALRDPAQAAVSGD